jgi:outer membrane immunogenic protein
MKEQSAGYVGGRLGYLITPTVLGYFDGGWTRTRFTQGSEFQTATGATIGFSYPGAFSQNGWFLGGGTEVSLADWIPIHGLFLRSEYRYAQYQGRNLAEFATATGALTGNVENTKASVQTITTSLVWKFNWLGH